MSHFVEEKRCEARDLERKMVRSCIVNTKRVSEAYYNEAEEESCDKNTVLTIMSPDDRVSEVHVIEDCVYRECKCIGTWGQNDTFND